MVQNPLDFNSTMICADNANNAMWLTGVIGGHGGGRLRRQPP